MGYLNAAPDDAYNLQALAQGGNTTSDLPGASGWDGMIEAPEKGIAAAAGVLGGVIHQALSGTIADDYVHTLFSGIDQANEALKPVFGYNPIAPYLDQQSRDSASAASATVQQWAATGDDPRIAGTLGRTVYGAAKGFGIMAAATPVLGPWGAAALYGGNEAHDNYKQNIAAGLDQDTSIELAGLTGVTSAAGAMAPIGGGNLTSRLFTSVLANQGLDVASRAASWGVLKANGYDAQAAQQKIFDMQSQAADVIMGLAFGAHAHLADAEHPYIADPSLIEAKPLDVNPADVDTSAAVLAQNHFEHSATGVAVDPGAANTHVRVMSDALDAMANGDEPKVSTEDAQTMAEGTLPDPSHDTAPVIRDAAVEEIPQFKDAVDNIPEIEPPVREAAEPIGQIPPDAEGKPAPAQFDVMTQQRIDRLTSQYGDMRVPDPDAEPGNLITVNQLAQRMQQQLIESDAMGRAHEAAAACFISTGSAA